MARNRRLSDYCADDFRGEAEDGFVGGFDESLQGYHQFLMVFYMPDLGFI
jgi:hypothetical protein